MWHGKADLLVEKFWEYRLVVLVPGVSLDMPGIRGSFFLMCFFCVEDDDRECFLVLRDWDFSWELRLLACDLLLAGVFNGDLLLDPGDHHCPSAIRGL